MVVPGCHADRGAVQLLGALHAELLVHQEALAVIVGDGGEIEAERGVARQRDGRVVGQDVDLARLQRGEALLGGERHVFHLLGIAEDGGRNRPADVDVEADPLALAVGQHEAGRAGADAANQRAARLDRVEVLAGHRAGRCEDRGQPSRRLESYAYRLPFFPRKSRRRACKQQAKWRPPPGGIWPLGSCRTLSGSAGRIAGRPGSTAC